MDKKTVSKTIHEDVDSDLRIQNFGQQELQTRLSQGHHVYTHCISITNPECTNEDDVRCNTPDDIRNGFKRTLELKFWDENDQDNLAAFSNQRIVSLSDIRSVIEFIESTKEEADGYTLHCWRGISRSPAIALGILQYIHKNETIASEKLIEIRRNEMPLKRAVELFDKMLQFNLSDFKNSVYKARMKALRKALRPDEN
jgi:predicted protein tyrosine phosphatase